MAAALLFSQIPNPSPFRAARGSARPRPQIPLLSHLRRRADRRVMATAGGDFYAPWCGHCKRLAPQLDEAAPVLAGLSTPIVIAKVNADKYKKLGSKYGVHGFPTLMFLTMESPRSTRARGRLICSLRTVKLVAPDVSVLGSDLAIKGFVEAAGTAFPLFIGFGVDESLISEYGAKYKKKAWFSTAKDFSDDMMVNYYDFDKVPALVSHNPKYNEQSVFYGPFEGSWYPLCWRLRTPAATSGYRRWRPFRRYPDASSGKWIREVASLASWFTQLIIQESPAGTVIN